MSAVGSREVRWTTGLDDDMWIKEEVDDEDDDGEPGVKDVVEEEVAEEDEVSGKMGNEGSPERIGNKKDKVLKKLTDPMMPSKEEVEEHILRGHIPYRNWCGICIKAMRKG